MTCEQSYFTHLEATTMRWRHIAMTAIDCLAVIAGAVIAVPFLLILAAPFYMGG